jgi:glucose/arabinose dehydrogenase
VPPPAGYCARITLPTLDLQAHSAPLGLAFYTGRLLSPRYRGGLFVAYHGSWNRSVPTGYKLVYVPVQGTRAGPSQDVVTGWRPAGARQAWGRPVGVLVAPDGSLLISDDTAGVIYRLAPVGR